jgi:hypothetical protein
MGANDAPDDWLQYEVKIEYRIKFFTNDLADGNSPANLMTA